MNARQKREQRRTSAQEWARAQEVPTGTPTEHGITVLPENVRDFVLWTRVSTSKQRSHLPLQREGAQLFVQPRKVLESFSSVETGKGCIPKQRPSFYRAVNYCREYSLPLVTPTISRFLRADDFNAIITSFSQPTEKELEDFVRSVKGVTLHTLLDPDCSPEDDFNFLAQLSRNAVLSRRSEAAVGATKRRKLHHIEVVFKLRKEGYSLRQIRKYLIEERDVSVSVNTLSRWVGKGKC